MLLAVARRAEPPAIRDRTLSTRSIAIVFGL